MAVLEETLYNICREVLALDYRLLIVIVKNTIEFSCRTLSPLYLLESNPLGLTHRVISSLIYLN